MIIEQKTIQTKATSQGAPQDLNSIYNIKGSGKYQVTTALNEYFLIYSDSPPITEEILVNQFITSDFAVIGGEELYQLPDSNVEDVIENFSYFIRKFYIFKILNGELVEKNYIGEVYEGIGGGGNAAKSIENQKQIKFGEFKFDSNEYVKKNLIDSYETTYNKKDFLTLKEKEPKSAGFTKISLVRSKPYKNLCDIILAETIKSYLL